MYYYVYQLISIDHTDRHYTGLTRNLARRLQEHNSGEVKTTANHAPWSIQAAVAFLDMSKATAFEKYLKSHSGRAFSKYHF